MDSEPDLRRSHSVKWIAFLAGAIACVFTWQIQLIDVIPSDSLLGAVKRLLMALITPGLFGSMILAGNAHAFNLASAAVLNGLLYFATVYLLWWAVSKISKRGA